MEFFLRYLPYDGLSLRFFLLLQSLFQLLLAFRRGNVLFDEFLFFLRAQRSGGEELLGLGVGGVLLEGLLALGEGLDCEVT